MDVTADLVDIVERAHSLGPILESATRVIAERSVADGCFAFLLDESEGLVQRAAGGPNESGRERAEPEARRVAAQVVATGRRAILRAETSLLASPMLLRDSLVGVLVLWRTDPRGFSEEEVEPLATICAQLVGIVENARIIDALDRGERPAPRTGLRKAVPQAKRGERVLQGTGVSPGIAISPAVFRGTLRLDLEAHDEPAGELEVERARVRTAMEKTRNDLLRIQIAAAREIDEEHALIFASHLLLLNDPTILGRIDERLARGSSAPRAIVQVLDEVEAQLGLVSDSYIREKIDDIDDLRGRLVSHVLGGAARTRFGARIVVTGRIPPSLVVELKTEGAQGLVTEIGGATSHGVLLARAMGIPTVTGVADMLGSVRPDETLIVDGTTGVVVVSPTPETVARHESERARGEQIRTGQARFRDVLATTADGARVKLYANVGVASDLNVARENGAEGIGLYRTEFPFIVRDAFPTLGEQTRIYKRAYDLFPGGPIHFRILDLGGDKFVAGGSIAMPRSAFHGYRSMRVLFDHPDVLRDQVQALALAAADRPLRILIPMITSIDELRRARALIDEAIAGLDSSRVQCTPSVGAMIEVPAAVELAEDIAKEVDFLSIGTNDLMQYTLVVDREDSRMAQLADPYHPAILRMIDRVTRAARAAKKDVAVCGEIAARPDMALALMALGVDTLSVIPTAIPELKQALAGTRLESMRRAMAATLALSDAQSVAASLRDAYAG